MFQTSSQIQFPNCQTRTFLRFTLPEESIKLKDYIFTQLTCNLNGVAWNNLPIYEDVNINNFKTIALAAIKSFV